MAGVQVDALVAPDEGAAGDVAVPSISTLTVESRSIVDSAFAVALRKAIASANDLANGSMSVTSALMSIDRARTFASSPMTA